MKNVHVAVISAICIAASYWPSQVSAANCGGGKVTAIMVGGWNTDDLMIRVDYSQSSNDHPGTEWIGKWIRYKLQTVGETRLKSIHAQAIAAYLSKIPVWTYSHHGRCDNATEIGTGER